VPVQPVMVFLKAQGLSDTAVQETLFELMTKKMYPFVAGYSLGVSTVFVS
jgi:hypothetical protein